MSLEFKIAETSGPLIFTVNNSYVQFRATSRLAAPYKQYFIKIDSSSYFTQTGKEITFYKDILQPEDSKYFPKFISDGYTDAGKRFIVTKNIDFGKFCSYEDFIKALNIVNSLRVKYGLLDLLYEIPHRESLVLANSTSKNWHIDKKGNVKIYDIGIYYNTETNRAAAN